MEDQEIHERLAILEEQQRQNVKLLEEIHITVKQLHNDIVRYKGFIGALVLLGSGVAAFLGILKGYVTIAWIKGGG